MIATNQCYQEASLEWNLVTLLVWSWATFHAWGYLSQVFTSSNNQLAIISCHDVN